MFGFGKMKVTSNFEKLLKDYSDVILMLKKFSLRLSFTGFNRSIHFREMGASDVEITCLLLAHRVALDIEDNQNIASTDQIFNRFAMNEFLMNNRASINRFDAVIIKMFGDLVANILEKDQKLLAAKNLLDKFGREKWLL